MSKKSLKSKDLNVNERKRLRSLLYKEQKCRCHWCGKFMYPLERFGQHPLVFSLEHLIPKSKGGTDSLINLVLAHRKCNEERGAT